MNSRTSVSLSGDRFTVWYRLTGDEQEAREKAADICVEQTVEFPVDLLPPGDIPEKIVGQLVNLEPAGPGAYSAEITYAVEIAGGELPQFLNVLFGNSSIKPGIRVLRFELPRRMLSDFQGPRFGRTGLRRYLKVFDRPLLCTAIKPMGLGPEALAEMTYQLALGGIDIIKDDHGLADQPFSPFAERVELCAEAVEKANAATGFKCVYMPNVTGPADLVHDNARLAKTLGAGALIVSPGITGFDALRLLADDDELALPIMAHPAFLGAFVTAPDNGIAHGALFGQIARLAGADASVFPNFGGRFSFTVAECREIAAGTAVPMGHIDPIFPAPGGGMTLDRIPEIDAVYGQEVIYLIGGNLHRHEGDLAASARKFKDMVIKQRLEAGSE